MWLNALQCTGQSPCRPPQGLLVQNADSAAVEKPGLHQDGSARLSQSKVKQGDWEEWPSGGQGAEKLQSPGQKCGVAASLRSSLQEHLWAPN